MGTLSIRRKTEEKELQAAGTLVGIRSQMEEAGMVYMGTLTMAAKAGYFTHRACDKMGRPVGADEEPDHCAVMADCPLDLCLIDEDGNRVRPCLPVYFRDMEETYAEETQ